MSGTEKGVLSFRNVKGLSGNCPGLSDDVNSMFRISDDLSLS